MGQVQSAAEGHQQQAQLQQLAERYQMKNREKLGEGSYGTVWKAVDRQTGKAVAVKHLYKAKLNSGASNVKPYLNAGREVALMGACQHENIAEIFGAFEDATNIYIAMELCHGGDLQSRIQKSSGSISEVQLVGWSWQMCSAVAALHAKRICHRDLKPHNFMLTGSSLLKLSDFGISVFLPKGKFLSERVGTPAYMAPEIHHLPRKSRGYSFPADAWALGLCIYYLGTSGRHPFLDGSGQLLEASLLSGHLSFGDDELPSWGGFMQSLRENMGAVAAPTLGESTELRHLCNSLVTPSAKDRMTAREALELPWMARGANLKQMQTVPSPINMHGSVPPGNTLQQQSHMRGGYASTFAPRQRLLSSDSGGDPHSHEHLQAGSRRVGPGGHADNTAAAFPPSPSFLPARLSSQPAFPPSSPVLPARLSPQPAFPPSPPFLPARSSQPASPPSPRGLTKSLQAAHHPVRGNGNLSAFSTTASTASQPPSPLSPRSFAAMLPSTISWPPSPSDHRTADQLHPQSGGDSDDQLPHLSRVPKPMQAQALNMSRAMCEVNEEHHRQPSLRHEPSRGGGFVAVPKAFEPGKLHVVYSPLAWENSSSPSFHL